MSRLESYRRQVLKIRDSLRLQIAALKAGDESVEGQASLFRIWAIVSAVALMIALVASVTSTKPSKTEAPTEAAPFGISKIPEGHSLVPIEPANLDALDSVFGSFGYADLFIPADSLTNGTVETKSKRILKSVPLLRAPQNRRRFAILLPDPEINSERGAGVMSALAAPVMVVVRRGPAKEKHRRLSSKPRPPVIIQEFEVAHENF